MAGSLDWNRQLLAVILEQQGGSEKPASLDDDFFLLYKYLKNQNGPLRYGPYDSIWNLVYKIVSNRGGNPVSQDSIWDLVVKWAETYGIDTSCCIVTNSLNDLLRLIADSGGPTPPVLLGLQYELQFSLG